VRRVEEDGGRRKGGLRIGWVRRMEGGKGGGREEREEEEEGGESRGRWCRARCLGHGGPGRRWRERRDRERITSNRGTDGLGATKPVGGGPNNLTVMSCDSVIPTEHIRDGGKKK
jgi:hypothetical protein